MLSFIQYFVLFGCLFAGFTIAIVDFYDYIANKVVALIK